MNKFFAVVSFVMFVSLNISAQQKLVCDESTNFLLDKEMPSVYLTFERFGKAGSWTQSKIGEWSDKSKIEKGDDIWLRLHNNSCWEIKFRTDSLYISKTTVDGKFKVSFGVLEDGAIANIQYSVEEQNRKQVSYGSDMANTSLLQSGKSVLFGVFKDHLSKSRSIYVDFSYGWEVKDFSNNLAPEHRTFFWGYRLEEKREKSK
jgi:hypothetical protein